MEQITTRQPPTEFVYNGQFPFGSPDLVILLPLPGRCLEISSITVSMKEASELTHLTIPVVDLVIGAGPLPFLSATAEASGSNGAASNHINFEPVPFRTLPLNGTLTWTVRGLQGGEGGSDVVDMVLTGTIVDIESAGGDLPSYEATESTT